MGQSTGQTVFLLPETDETTLCLRLTGKVSAQDYMAHFDGPVRKIAKDNGWYNLYVYHDPAFEGWSQEAADLSFKCISEISPKAHCLAYVNPPEGRMVMMKVLKPMLKAEVRYFNENEQAEAMAWIKSCARESAIESKG